jgi:bifunctional UDP-N-acetylglucosamine pyrophosphorylase/glucosamine-1-phosphate N-acetyltransferase
VTNYVFGVIFLNTIALILSAGDGKRMKSQKPKVLHEVLFKPMLRWVLEAAEGAGVSGICVVVGSGRELIEKYLDGKYQLCVQHERLGTGHAALQALDFLKQNTGSDVIILYGDAPFISSEIIKASYAQHKNEGNAVTIITADAKDPFNYGRIKRDEHGGNVVRIVEQKDATAEEMSIKEINSGAYWFNTEILIQTLGEIKNDNAQGEYYLTSAVELINSKGLKCGTYKADDMQSVTAAANDIVQLMALNETARKNVLLSHMRNGVSILNDNGIIIGGDVQIGTDTLILPGTIIKGETTIGSGCTIGPNSLIDSCEIGNNVIFNASQAYRSKLGNGVTVGPFSHIRPNCSLHDMVHVGDFVEVKNSEVGEGTKLPHLTYIGDSDVGSHVNVGCGCVTANYDGKTKSRTTIGSNSFISCHTVLVAPVKVGDNAYTGAGSTITHDVPKNALAVARARQENKENWGKNKKIKILIAEALEKGFSQAGKLNCEALEFLPEVRDMCAADRCHSYGKNWACPPACGTIEAAAFKASQYSYGIIVQTTGHLDDDFDYETMQATGEKHKNNFEKFVTYLRGRFSDILPMGAGACTICAQCTYPDAPCRFPDRSISSMEAYGLFVSKVCTLSDIKYNYGPLSITYTSCILFE